MYENVDKPVEKRPAWWLVVAVGITAVVLIIAATLIWYILELRPVDRHASGAVSFQLKSGTHAEQLATQLKTKGIIRSSTAFTWYVSITGLRRTLQAGNYELNPSDTTPEIARALSNGKTAKNIVTVPEGSTIFQIRKLVAPKGITADQFNAALGASYSNSFLAGKPADVSLEGYLFPDSYQISKPVNARDLVQQMLDTFAKKVVDTGLPQAYTAEGLTLHQGVTLASIVEKEVPNATDRAMVAGVFMNRLKAGMPLESDVTVDYASQLSGKAFSTALDSPYNTYVNPGLPPGPICNPGTESMQAVARPTTSDYLYFVAGKDGKTHFAKTFAEHQANVDTYLK